MIGRHVAVNLYARTLYLLHFLSRTLLQNRLFTASNIRKLPLVTADPARFFKKLSNLNYPSVNKVSSSRRKEAPVEVPGKCN